MANSLAQKLKIKEGTGICTLNAPAGFKQKLGPLPAEVTISPDLEKNYAQLHWFVNNKAEMEKRLDKILSLLKNDVICWIYYPKGSSKIQTDLTRDKGWDALLEHKELQWLSLISFDETWSAFAMRLKTKADEEKEAKPKERPILNYINSAAKEVHLPGDFSTALQKQKKLKEYFDGLAFSHRKEYVAWIVSAKKEETRMQRIKKAMEMLSEKRKNPFNG